MDRDLPVIAAVDAARLWRPPTGQTYLDLLDARSRVDGWTTAADVARTKPHPDPIAAALDMLDVREVVVIGDTPFDVEAAARAGVETVAMLTGGFSEAELREAGAVCVFASIVEPIDALDETPLRV